MAKIFKNKCNPSDSLMSAQDLLQFLGNSGKSGFIEIRSSESSAKKEAWKRHFIVLYGNVIQVYKDDKSEETLECISFLGYEKVYRLNLEGCPWSFSLAPYPTISSLKTRTFSCSSNVNLQEWLREFGDCIKYANGVNNLSDCIKYENGVNIQSDDPLDVSQISLPKKNDSLEKAHPAIARSSSLPHESGAGKASKFCLESEESDSTESNDFDSASCSHKDSKQKQLLGLKQNHPSPPSTSSSTFDQKRSDKGANNQQRLGRNALEPHGISYQNIFPPRFISRFHKSKSMPSAPKEERFSPPFPSNKPSRFSDGVTYFDLYLEEKGTLYPENDSVVSASVDDEYPDYDDVADPDAGDTDPISPFLQECLVTDPKLERDPAACKALLKSKDRVGTYLLRKSRTGENLVLSVLTEDNSVVEYPLEDINSRIRFPSSTQYMTIEELLQHFTLSSYLPYLNHFLTDGAFKHVRENADYEEINTPA